MNVFLTSRPLNTNLGDQFIVHDSGFFLRDLPLASLNTHRIPISEIYSADSSHVRQTLYEVARIKKVQVEQEGTLPCDEDSRNTIRTCMERFTDKKLGCRLPWYSKGVAGKF